jgi:3'-phosphoadenosine 5'-phosphosulfate sulfotransferase (PAPS reductase)/FAD synthetase
MDLQKFNTGCGLYNILEQSDINKYTHVVSFSGGRTSGYLLHKMIESYGKENIKAIFANTGRESEATLEFVRDCEKHFDINITWLEYDLDESGKEIAKVVSFETADRKGQPLYKAIKKTKVVPNFFQRHCTINTKIQTISRHIIELGLKEAEVIQYIGIRHDEPKRWSKYYGQFDISGRIKCYPLVDWKVTKQQVLDFWKSMPFDLNLVEPFGNCDLCHLKSIKKRIAVLKQKPEIAIYWAGIEEEMGHTFDNEFPVKTQLKIATGQTIADLSKERDYDIECNCNVD